MARSCIMDPDDDKDWASTKVDGESMHPVLDIVHHANKCDCGPDARAHSSGVDYYGHANWSCVAVVRVGDDLDHNTETSTG